MFLVSCFKEITSSLIVISYSAFPLIKVSASESGTEIRLERSDFGRRHFETLLAARPCLCDVIPSDSKLAGKRKTDLASFTRPAKSTFSAIIHFTIFNAIISEFGARLVQNNYGSRAAISPWEAIRTKFLGRNDVTKCGLAAEYCSKWRQRRSNFGLLWRRIS